VDAPSLGFGARIVLAFKLLFDGLLAGRAARALEAPSQLEPRQPDAADAGPTEPWPAAQPAPAPGETAATGALQLLAILQREGRLVDFLNEDVADFSDADIGAAARVVHEGCKKALAQYVQFEAIRSEGEGDPITVPAGFDAGTLRLTGNVVGEPPFSGHLAHHGWRVTAIDLPTLAEGHDPHVVAPAEVELP
jgi:hypothetical protein